MYSKDYVLDTTFPECRDRVDLEETTFCLKHDPEHEGKDILQFKVIRPEFIVLHETVIVIPPGYRAPP